MVIHFRFSFKIVNIKTAFLHGDIEKEIHMECPLGIKDVGKDDYIVLDECIFGLVQAVMQNYENAIKILKKAGSRKRSICGLMLYILGVPVSW